MPGVLLHIGSLSQKKAAPIYYVLGVELAGYTLLNILKIQGSRQHLFPVSQLVLGCGGGGRGQTIYALLKINNKFTK